MPEMTIQQAFELAIQHHQAGRLNEAESLYRQILAVEPRHADALHLLGVIAAQAGRHDAAIELIRQAIALAPGVPDFHSNLGAACREAGQLDEAIAALRQAIALKSDFPGAHNNLGSALREMGQLDEAIAAYREAIALKSDFPEAHNNLGNALKDKGHLDEAIASYRQALALRPNFTDAHNNLGIILRDKGQLDEAIAAHRQALALRPDFPEAHISQGNALKDKGHLDEAIASYRQALALQPNLPETHDNLGITLRDKGQLDEAIAAHRQALALRPDFPEAHINLGNALKDKGQLDEAIAAYRLAIALRPSYPEAHNNLGSALKDKGQLELAIATYRQAIALRPEYPETYYNLANALKDKGQLDEAIAAYRQALALRPNFPEAHGNLVFCMNYHPGLEASAIAEEHRRWNQVHAEPLRPFIQSHANDRAPDRRLRIGYVSPDFRSHSVAYFLEGLLAGHDRAKVEAYCYSNVIHPDAVTVRLESLATHWRRIIGLSDSQVTDLTRADGIDILVDLAGHTARSRLQVFARKPAPVQVTWLGYPNTTGLDTMDYRITDSFADPPGSNEHLYSEQLIRLPRSAWCYCPYPDSPPITSPSAHNSGHITFGSFNAMPKINRPLLELWSGILLAVPGSRLLLKTNSLGESSMQQQLGKQFQEMGIGPERVEIVGRVPNLSGHLATYGRVDIALDTFPYHGTTTTCEALWMGVPVVSMAGQTHVSRVGVSLLTNLGHPEWIAASPEEYVKIAVELANDLPRLASLRSSLREKMQASPLMDAAGFARDIEAAYRKIWRTWCEQPESQPCPK